MIDGIVRPPIIGPRRDRQHAVGDRDAGIRLNHVDVIGRDLGAVAASTTAIDVCGCSSSVETAFVPGIQVLDDHQRQPGPRRQRGEELRERTEPAGRRADAHDRERVLSSCGHIASIDPGRRHRPAATAPAISRANSVSSVASAEREP